MQPLLGFKSNQFGFNWTSLEQKVYDEIKWIMAQDSLLVYPGFNKIFYIKKDAIKFQLGTFLRYSFYICKLAGPQMMYTVT